MAARNRRTEAKKPSLWVVTAPASNTTTNTARGAVALLLFCIITLSGIGIVLSEQQEIYGTQCSFAITGSQLDGCDPNMLDHRQRFYDNYMEGCYKRFSKELCSNGEYERLDNNQYQPMGMINMTSTGFLKLKAPESLKNLLTNFWEKNKDNQAVEDWYDGAIFTNHWEAPTYMVGVEDDQMIDGGDRLKRAIWNAAIDGIAQWTGGVAKLRPVSLYGIRVYTEGAVLSPHVDRTPLVSSGIFNVAQDVDEPWPLEVYDRNGHAVNITMEPGDMVFYESHSLIHGRPFALKGRYFANVFIHFEPFDGWDTRLGDNNGDLPPYILPGTRSEEEFRKNFPNGWSKFFAEGEEPPVGEWAVNGKLDKLQAVAAIDVRMLWFQDENGWEPIHEAARVGRLDIIQFLVESGAGINDLTADNMSAYRLALNNLGPDHPVSIYLEDLGAEDSGYKEDWREQRNDQWQQDDDMDEDDEYQAYNDEQEIEQLEEQLEEQLAEVSRLRDSIRGVGKAVERKVVVADDDEDL